MTDFTPFEDLLRGHAGLLEDSAHDRWVRAQALFDERDVDGGPHPVLDAAHLEPTQGPEHAFESSADELVAAEHGYADDHVIPDSPVGNRRTVVRLDVPPDRHRHCRGGPDQMSLDAGR